LFVSLERLSLKGVKHATTFNSTCASNGNDEKDILMPKQQKFKEE